MKHANIELHSIEYYLPNNIVSLCTNGKELLDLSDDVVCKY